MIAYILVLIYWCYGARTVTERQARRTAAAPAPPVDCGAGTVTLTVSV